MGGTTPLGLDLPVAALRRRRHQLPADLGRHRHTYTLTAADVGHQVLVSVEATNSAGSAQSTSAPPAAGGPVAADPPQSTTAPVVSGVAEDGATLAAGSGGWTGTEPLTFAYQRQCCDTDGANCTDIAGETARPTR